MNLLIGASLLALAKSIYYGKFASYLVRVLCKRRLIFPRINGPNNSVYFSFKLNHFSYSVNKRWK